MNACHPHPWTTTAPWYAWARAGVPSSGRGTAPLIQKFASDDFINEFLRDPQHSLEFDADIDQVYTVQFVQANPGQFAGKIAALFPTKDAAGTPLKKGEPIGNLNKSRLVGTGMRKLYLPSHARHYLVVGELHCDVPGFPPPGRDKLCQAGFVVRRRRLEYSADLRPEALALLRKMVAAQAVLADLDGLTPMRPKLAQARASRIARLKGQGRFDAQRTQADAALAAARQDLEAWQIEHGIRAFKEAWVPGASRGIGEWLPLLDETPQALEEAWYPLYPLFANPKDAGHSAHGRALYYGVVPTSAFDTSATGEPRYDDRSTYEMRCVYRQHDCHCPLAGLNTDAPDCGGALVWSPPTEQYRLAPQFDLLGTANRPVTIQMPNLAELAAQGMARPIGQFSPVRFVQPQSLSTRTDGKGLSGGSMGGAAICFFSIPLITIIASFVLNLFLPIVVLMFNLWFLLALRFCIPPSFSIDGGLQAELALIPPKLNVDAGLSVDVDAGSFALLGKSGVTIQAELVDALAGTISETTGIAKATVKPELQKYSNAPLVSLSNVLFDKAHKTVEPDGSIKGTIDLVSGLVYRPHRTSQWKYETHLPTTGEFA